MKVTQWPIENVIPYDNNPRVNDDAVEYVANSIKEFGWQQPIVVDNDGVVIAGHTRLSAAQKLGLTHVPVSVAENLTDEQVKAYRLADNKTSEFANWDWDKLTEELDDICDIDMEEFGFDIDNDVLDDTEAEDDGYTDEQAEQAPARVKRGDIWQLGQNRLMCGDSTTSDVALLMGNDRADVCFTSPPYNMNQSQRFDSGKINPAMGKGEAYNEFSDDLNDDDYGDFLVNAIENAIAFCDDSMFNIGILSGSKSGLLTALFTFKDKLSDIIVWNKSQSMPSGLPSHKGIVSHRCELIFCFNENGSRSFSHPQWSIGTQINRIDTENASGNEYAKIHSATFPINLASAVIRDYTESSVMDLFGGTGTTLIAAEQLNRKCYMMELDPHYCDVIIDRWESLTGMTAKRVDV